MDILFVSRICPGERIFGSDTRTVQVLRWLAESGRRVHFAHLSRDLVGRPPAKKIRSLLASYRPIHIAGCRVPGLQPLQWRALTRPRSSFLQRYVSRLKARYSVAEQLDQQITRTGATALWVDHTFVTPAIVGLPRRDDVLRIVDTHDVMHQRDASFQSRGFPVEHEVSREEEQHLLSQYDVIVAIQDHERKVFERLVPQRTVVTVGHAIEVAPQPCTSMDVGFVGSRYLVNETSLLAFLEHAWPAIRRTCPGTKLQVAGGVCERGGVVQAAKRDDRIVLRGVVPQASDMYAGPAVMICPLWVGSGLKIKMVEALAHAKAVVATPIAAQGLEDGIDDAFCLAHRPVDFIEPVIGLLQDKSRRQQLEQSAARYAGERFNAPRVWQQMDQILRAGPAAMRTSAISARAA